MNRQSRRAPSDNERITLEQRVHQILLSIRQRRDEIAATLAQDVPYDRFEANISQALRRDPEILYCTTASIVNACIHAAYDGLRLDGREAVLVAHNVKIGTGTNEKWEKQAEYFPMVRGLIKKILVGGKVVSIEVETIHVNDQYRIVRGTDPSIYHVPVLDGDRGRIIAAYSIALLGTGERVTEVMTRADLDRVRAAAKTDYVWKAWEGEMSKKAVLRRHEKRLPSGRDFVDIEAQLLYPQFQQDQQQALPAPARPTRQQFQALSHDPFSGGVPLDIGATREREAVRAGGESEEQTRERVNPRARAGERADIGAQEDPGPTSNEQGADELPADGAEWSMWQADVLNKIGAASSVDQVNAVHAAEKAVLAAAAPALADTITAALTDRIAELMSGDDA